MAHGVKIAMAKKNKLPPNNAAAKAEPVKSKSIKPIAKSTTTASPKSAAAAKPATSSKSAAVAKSAAPMKSAALSKPSPTAVKAASKSAPTKSEMTKADADVPSPVATKAAVKSAPGVSANGAAKPVAAKAATVQQAEAPVRAPQASPQRAMPAVGVKPAEARLTAAAGPAKAEPARIVPAAAASKAVDTGPKKSVTTRHGFKTSELIVYPAHGVGRIIGIEEQEIAGISLELFVIEFEKDKMTLRVPTSKLTSVGMRKLAEDDVLKKAMDTLKGKARIKRTMWSRRAQEYEAKINSGDLVAIAEVVRDLYRSEAQPEQSYSERQLYEAALDRMSRELAAVDKSDERSAMQRITEVLAKSARGRRAVEDSAAQAAADSEFKAA